MKKRYLIYGVCLVTLFALAVWKQMQPTAKQTSFLLAMQSMTSLKGVVIRPDKPSDGVIEVVVTNVADLVETQNALRMADVKPMGGHNGLIFESTVTFLLASGESVKVRASIHKYDPENLYLSRNFLRETKPGVFVATGVGDNIRVGGFGPWIAAKVKFVVKGSFLEL